MTTLILSSVVALSCVALTLWRRAGLSISKRQAGCLGPELAAAIRNGGSADVLELCGQYRRWSLARIASEVVLKSRRLGGSPSIRCEMLRIIANQAFLREQQRLSRASMVLRSVAFLSAAIGLMVAASNMADALGFVTFCEPEQSHMADDISQALSSLAATICLSMFAFLLYKYLEAGSRTALVRLRDDSSALLHALLP